MNIPEALVFSTWILIFIGFLLFIGETKYWKFLAVIFAGTWVYELIKYLISVH